MSDTSVVDNSTGKEKKSRYTSGTIYKMIIAITFLLAFGLIMIFSASSYGTAPAISEASWCLSFSEHWQYGDWRFSHTVCIRSLHGLHIFCH